MVETYDLTTMRGGTLFKLTGIAGRTQRNMVKTLRLRSAEEADPDREGQVRHSDPAFVPRSSRSSSSRDRRG